MTRFRPTRLWPLLLAFAPVIAGAAGPVPPRDVAAQWRDFLATGDRDAVYDVLSDAVADQSFDAPPTEDLCRERTGLIADALAKAPVSIAAQYLAFQCAQVLGDEAAAERHVADLGALAQHALASGSEDWAAPPIRVVGGYDIYALLAASGLEFRSEILMPVPLRRHLVYRVIAWDPVAKQERHLYFDFVDTVIRLSHRDPLSVYPSYRQSFIDGTIESLARSQALGGLDLKLARDAVSRKDSREIVDALRPMTERGGHQSASRWLWQCRHAPFEGCGEGLVDALLPQAEERLVMPTLLLAHAYALGLGVDKDMDAAMALVDGAETQWGGGRATMEFARMYRSMEVGPLPAVVTQRLQALSAEGKPLATAMLAYEALEARDAKGLPEAMVPALEAAAREGSVSAMRILAIELNAAGDQAAALPWLRQAAEAGDAASQEIYGSILYFGHGGVARDQAEGRRWWREAAQGGDTDAMTLSGWQAEMREDWSDAFEWYASASRFGDDEGSMAAAALLERDLEGLDGGPERALKIYESMQASSVQAEVRRRMSAMYREGNGTGKDLVRARELLEQDAEKGDRQSQIELGVFLLNGSLGDADPVQGKAWMEKAMADGNGEAYDAYATYLYYQDATPEARREAMRLWNESMDKPGDWGLNNAAWVKCVSPMDELRVPAEGLVLAKRMGEPAGLPAAKLDTLAACHAANEDFAAATTTQQAALDWMKEYAPQDGSVGEMRDRLTLYQERKGYIEPEREREEAARSEGAAESGDASKADETDETDESSQAEVDAG